MSELDREQESRRPWLAPLILLLLIGVALALRWRYIQGISLSIDEFNTLWAAKQIPIRGLPIFPSGNLYPHGFLFTYLAVPFVLGPFSETLGRVPGLIVGLAGLLVAYGVGRKLFSERVGLLAAATMAVDPDFIIWGGRARMYGLLQLFALLAIGFYYRGLADDRPRDRALAALFISAAIFCHAEAILLLPGLAVATLVFWGFPRRVSWQRLLRWSVILPYGIAGAAAAVFYAMSRYGQPGHLEAIQEIRPYLDISANILSGPRALASVFTSPHRLPFSLLALAGLCLAFRPRFDRRLPLTYLYVILICFLIPLLFLGPTWQNVRYLFVVLPLFFFIGGEVLCYFLDRVPAWRKIAPWQSVTLCAIFLLAVGLTGARTAYQQEPGYDRAFRYLQDRAQADDQVLTMSPAACAVYLGRCDGFAIQRGYQEYVIPRPGDGVPADLWTATPVLTTTAALIDLLSTSSSVWLVTDGWRFQTRYEADFIQTVIDHMDLAHTERGVLVFHAQGYAPTDVPTIQRERKADFGRMELVGFGLSSAAPKPGDTLEITLQWKALAGAGLGYTAFLHLLREDGSGVAGVDEPVLRGLFQPDLWPQDRIFSDRHHLKLPAELAPGRYRLDLGLYPTGRPDQLQPVGGGDRLPLSTLVVGGTSSPARPTNRTDVDFGGKIRLLGYDGKCNERLSSCRLTFYWQALLPTDRDYTVFVHLSGPHGGERRVVAQHDGPPGGAFFPTSTWLPGQVVLDTHSLTAPAGVTLVPGEYSVLVGLYDQPTDSRLPATDAEGNSLGDAIPLITFQMGSETP